MRHEKTYKFEKWNEWDHFLSSAIADFFQVYMLYPNIFMANDCTHSQIDFITTYNLEKNDNAHLIVNEEIGNYLETLTSEGTEEVCLSSYKKGNCELDFAVNPELLDKEFVLVYDDEPDWGDVDESPVPDIEGKIPVNA